MRSLKIGPVLGYSSKTMGFKTFLNRYIMKGSVLGCQSPSGVSTNSRGYSTEAYIVPFTVKYRSPQSICPSRQLTLFREPPAGF